MAVSSNPEHFFQTTSSIAENERKQRKAANTVGSPLKFSTKLLSINAAPGFDPDCDTVFVAEAGGTISRIQLSTNEVARIGKPSPAPLTSLAYLPSRDAPASQVQHVVFASGWDKTITQYVLQSVSPPDTVKTSKLVASQTSFKAHTDFVKCLLVLQTSDHQPILISGGADGELNVWALSTTDTAHPDGQNNESGNKTTRLATVKPQARGIESIVLDPYSDPSQPKIYFSTSQREIFSLIIPSLPQISSSTLQSSLSDPLVVHETSVYKLHFDSQGDLWTASADKSAKHLVRSEDDEITDKNQKKISSLWTCETTLTHPDFVRDVVTHPNLPYVVTACRDENIRLWNVATAQLHHVLTGHFEEVTGLAIVDGFVTVDQDSAQQQQQQQQQQNTRIDKKNKKKSGKILVSVSIDATLRRWSLDPKDVKQAIEEAKNPDPDPTSVANQQRRQQQQNQKKNNTVENNGHDRDLDLGMTAEEEAELQAMMDELED